MCNFQSERLMTLGLNSLSVPCIHFSYNFDMFCKIELITDKRPKFLIVQFQKKCENSSPKIEQ